MQEEQVLAQLYLEDIMVEEILDIMDRQVLIKVEEAVVVRLILPQYQVYYLLYHLIELVS